jgi:hypothetical protein
MKVHGEQMHTWLLSGVTVRKLYTRASLIDEEQRQHLLEIAAFGAQVRISAATPPNEAIIVDCRAMAHAGPRRGGDRESTATTAPSPDRGAYGPSSTRPAGRGPTVRRGSRQVYEPARWDSPAEVNAIGDVTC